MDDYKFGLAAMGGIVIAVLAFVVYYWPASEAMMTVRSMEWSRTVQDVETYTVIDCDTRTRRKSDGSTETYQDCGPETRTRVANQWVTSGVYPQEPYWPESYSIRYSERRYENYTVTFSDDKNLYPYRTGSLADYNRFQPRQKCKVTLNIFGVAIRADAGG